MSKTKISENVLDTKTFNENTKKVSDDGLHVSWDEKKVTLTTKLITYDDESTETIVERTESEIDEPAPVPESEVNTQEPMRRFNGVTWYCYNYDNNSWEVDSDQTDHITVFLNN